TLFPTRRSSDLKVLESLIAVKKLTICKKMAASIIISFIAVAAHGFQRVKSWRNFSPAAGGFTVLLPGKPTAETNQYGSVTEHSYIVDADWATYAVAYYEYSKALSDPEAALNF